MQMIRKNEWTSNDVRYWLYSPGEGASIWDRCCEEGIIAIGWDEIGDLSAYFSKEEMKKAMQVAFDSSKTFRNDALATWQFANEMKPGDIVFAKKGLHLIIGCGVVKSDYEYTFDGWDYFNNIRRIEWLKKGEWPHPGRTAMKTLTDITSYTDYVEELKTLIETHSSGKAFEQIVEEKTALHLETEELNEEAIEHLINFTDPNAKWEIVTSTGKRREFNQKFIDNLKKAYNGCCQICGKNPMAGFDASICEAHHIDYFSRSQNNDSNNIIILCPNHHRLIHKCNPRFDRDKKAFIFDDKKELPVLLDYHLKSE